jgi:hypothetical protein
LDKYTFLKQFISNFLHGKENAEAIIQSLADEYERRQELSVAVNNQLYISTSSDVYLDKNLTSVVVRPAELGVDDLAFRKLGIQLKATKQISEAVHAILETFYGEESVRAYTTCANPAPYFFEPGDDLIISLENGEKFTITVSPQDFVNIQQATAKEVADLITRAIRARGLKGYAQEFLDVDTGNRFVRIFGGARGPYSFVQIHGGRVQNEMEFPEIRDTNLPVNNTVWEITRTSGQTHRFRWVSGSKPLLENVLPGDSSLIYGNGFESVGIAGTFEVTDVSPAGAVPAINSGWFEITIPNFAGLRTTPPGQLPAPNTPPIFYSFTVAQTSYNDLKFFLPKRNTPYGQTRYALAWEPDSNKLKVYVPATTKVVKRDLIGSAHLHLLYPETTFNGSFGSSTNIEAKVQVINDRAIRYRQAGYDHYGTGGTLSYLNPNLIEVDIDYVFRENGYTTVVTSTPHGLPTVPSSVPNLFYTNLIVNVSVDLVLKDDPDKPFLGAYVIDPQANYTLTSQVGNFRERVFAGEYKRTLVIEGTIENTQGNLWLDLNKTTEEGPVPYLSSQKIGNTISAPILEISQNGTNIVVNTQEPHFLKEKQQIVITGTVNFNGVWSVESVPDSDTFTLISSVPLTVTENTGTVAQESPRGFSIVIIDPAYAFKKDHDIGADATVMSDSKAYEPSPDGTDYGFYVTGTSEGRVFAESIIQEVLASGITFEIIVIYPDDTGFGHYFEPIGGLKVNDSEYVWGA